MSCKDKLSDHVIRFEGISPYLGLAKGNEPGYFRPEYFYVGPSTDRWVKKCDSFDIHLLVLPAWNSTSSLHIMPDTDVFILVAKGRCLFWDKSGDQVTLEELDAIYLRNHPYAYRNVGRSEVILVVALPPNQPPINYDDNLYSLKK